jgi:ribose transport system substrate-binding protein
MFRKSLAVCATGALALAAAACSSSSGGSTDSPGSGQSSQVATELAKVIADHNNDPTSVPIQAEPLKSKPKAGTTIDVLSSPTAESADWRAGTQQAAEALGMKYKYVNIGSSADSVVSAWNSVVSERPDVVIMNGFPPQIYQHQLDEYTAGGGIAIGFALGVPGIPKGFKWAYFRNDSVSNATPMQLMAAEIATHGAGKHAQVLFVNAPIAPILTAQGNYFKTALAQCSYCSLAGEKDVDFSSIGSTLPQQVVSYLQSHSDVNYVALAFGAMAQGLPESLKAAGLDGKVQIVTHAGSSFNYDLVRSGTQLSDVADDFHFEGARLADGAARILAGQDPGADVSVNRTVTKSTIGDMKFYNDGTWQARPDVLADFQKAWAGQ